MHATNNDIDSGLSRNLIINSIGNLIPLFVTLILLPILVRVMGPQRYGFMSILMLFTGYLSLFDFGIGKAANNLIYNYKDHEDSGGPLVIFWETVILEIIIGTGLAILIIVFAPIFFKEISQITATDDLSLTRSLYIVAGSAPAITMLSGIRGTLAADRRFDLINLGRIPGPILTYGGAIFVAIYAHSYIVLACLLTTIQYILLFQNLLTLFSIYGFPQLTHHNLWKRNTYTNLLGYGFWIMLSDMAAPITLYMERFTIAGILSLTALGLYAPVNAVITKIAIIPVATSAVLFSEISSLGTLGYAKKAGAVIASTIKYIFVILTPIIAAMITFGGPAIGLWLGGGYENLNEAIVPVLAVGALFNGLAHIPYTVLRAAGRARVTARMHLAELPVYLLVLYLLIAHIGLVGAALAWSVKAAAEFVFFSFKMSEIYPLGGCLELKSAFYGAGTIEGVFVGGMLLCEWMHIGFEFKLIALLLGIVCSNMLLWLLVLTEKERKKILKFLVFVKIVKGVS